MTVKVLGTTKYKCTCKHCRSSLEYEFTDIQLVKTNPDYLGDFDTFTGIYCPVCSSPIQIRTPGY